MMNTTTPDSRRLLWRIRVILVVFIVCLVTSGLTAIPVRTELGALAWALDVPPGANPMDFTGLQQWIAQVREGVEATGRQYPFIFYGFDWLAFAHIVLGILFLGPVLDPVRNLWVITFGMIACGLVVVWAMAVGPFRGIPIYWSLVDCSFGVFGFLPLALARRYTVKFMAAA
jgi:hypothetical protein